MRFLLHGTRPLRGYMMVYCPDLIVADYSRFAQGRSISLKPLACYGVLLRNSPPQADQMLRRFVQGRPVSAVTVAFLAWCSERLAAQALTALFLLWDNASWHKSHAVRTWLRRHNQHVKATGHGVRIVACRLPVKTPWLNPIRPKGGMANGRWQRQTAC